MVYDKRVYELSNKYYLSEQDIYLRKIDYILKEYGSMENFELLYLAEKLTGSALNIAKRLLRRVIDIDSNFSINEYDDLYNEFCVESGFFVYSSEEFKETLDKKMNESVSAYSLSERDREVLRLRYLSNPKLSFNEIGEEIGEVGEKVIQIRNTALIRFAKILKQCDFFEFNNLDSIYSSYYLTNKEKKEVAKIKEYIITSDLLWRNVAITDKDKEMAERLRRILRVIKERKQDAKENGLLGEEGKYMKTIKEKTQLEKLKGKKIKLSERVNELRLQVGEKEKLLKEYNRFKYER